jgi:hypothetical protein
VPGDDRHPRPSGAHLVREARDVVGPIVPAAVDEERRGAGDAARVGRFDILRDAGRVLALTERVSAVLDVEPQLLRVVQQVAHRECVSVLQQEVVHPRPPLSGSGLRHLRGIARVLEVRAHRRIGDRE